MNLNSGCYSFLVFTPRPLTRFLGFGTPDGFPGAIVVPVLCSFVDLLSISTRNEAKTFKNKSRSDAASLLSYFDRLPKESINLLLSILLECSNNLENKKGSYSNYYIETKKIVAHAQHQKIN